MRLICWLFDDHPLGTFLWGVFAIITIAVLVGVSSHLCWCA
jgi:hypothetical protein